MNACSDVKNIVFLKAPTSEKEYRNIMVDKCEVQENKCGMGEHQEGMVDNIVTSRGEEKENELWCRNSPKMLNQLHSM